MNILILSTRLPYPLMGGDRIRIYNICKVLAQQHDVELLVISEERLDEQHVRSVEELGIRVYQFSFSSLRFKWNAARGIRSNKPIQVSYYYFTSVQRWIDSHIHQYDMVLCNHIRSAEYVQHLPITKVIDLHDAISLNYSRAIQYSKGIWKKIYSIENNRVLPYELQAIKNFDAALIVSPVDRQFLIERGADEHKLHVLPVAVPNELFSTFSDKPEQDWIVFVGKMNTVANSDAAVYFATSLFPQIQAIMPNVEFYIVGADPTPDVLTLSSLKGVHVTGKVENHFDYIRQAKVVVDPMRFGAGMQNKVLEAMALRKPVVASSLAVEGIGGEHGKHYFSADTISDSIEYIVKLFNDSTLRENIGIAASAFVRERYSWEVVSHSLHAMINNLQHV